MAYASSRLGAQEAIIKPCDLCEDEENVNWFCKDCDQNLCDRCKRIHLKSNVSKSHSVLSISVGFAIAKRNISNICRDHDEPFLFFCRTCDKTICSKCLSSDHRKHDFIDLGELRSEMEKTVEDAVREKQEEMKIMSRNCDDLVQNDKDLDRSINEWSTQIDDRVKSITLATEEEGRNLKYCLHSARENHTQEVEKCKLTIQAHAKRYEDEIQAIRQELRLQPASSLRGFVAKSMSKLNSMRPITFEIPNTSQLFSRGTFDQTHIRQMIGKIGRTDTDLRRENVRLKEETKPNVLSELNIIRALKLNRNDDCYSIHVSPNGSIWIGGNGSVLTISPDYSTILQQIPARKSFWSCSYIACLQSGEAVVSYGGYPYVDRFTLDGRRVQFADISPILTYDIAITRNDEVVLNINHKSIAIFSKDGWQLKQFEFDEGVHTFSGDQDGHLIIEHKKFSNFSVLDITGGKVELTFTVPIKDIWRFACDRHAHVLATNGKVIYLFNRDGQVMQTFKVSCECIKGICVNHDGSLLILLNRLGDNSLVFAKYCK